MKALVFEDKGEQKVVDLSEKEFPVHSDLTWMDAPDGCEVGWLLKTGKLIAPTVPELTYAEKRQIEYPTIQELVVALYDTDDKADIEAKRAEVKKKYPKP
tara:strand:- start:30 stop:329 length:300 start_codon:yes stop_codon:yes gene_type:complete